MAIRLSYCLALGPLLTGTPGRSAMVSRSRSEVGTGTLDAIGWGMVSRLLISPPEKSLTSPFVSSATSIRVSFLPQAHADIRAAGLAE